MVDVDEDASHDSAKYITFAAALSTLFGFCFLAWFIRRLGFLELDAALMGNEVQRPKPQPMVEVRNPFTMTVVSTSFADHVRLLVSCMQACHIGSYWKVKQQCLNQILEKSSQEDDNGEKNANLHSVLKENCEKVICREFTDTVSEKEVMYDIEDPCHDSDSHANEVGKEVLLYDMVVVMELAQEPTENTHPPSGITAMVSAITLRRVVERFRIDQLEQFIQTRNGKLFRLKKLYLEELRNDEEPSNEQDHAQSSNLCIVCQTLAISRALIPCGHACLCSLCFDKMSACPMCRQPVTSSFVLREEPNLNQDNPFEFSDVLKQMNPLEIIKGIYRAS